jgi:peptidoglycan hydrolase FlgJ
VRIEPLSLPITQAANAAQPKEDIALRKACGEFEAFLIGQMLKEMRATVPKSELFGSREQEETFQDMMDSEVAKELSKTKAFGIGDLLYAHMSKPQTAKVPQKAVDK